MPSITLDAYKLAFEINPIILTGGLLGSVPGAAAPILSFVSGAFFNTLFGAATGNLTLDNAFAHFMPLPGTTVIDNAIGEYPFANQTVAANAIIVQPLTVSMLMVCPARGVLGYALKLAAMTAIVATFQQHNSLGGTYTILQPSQIFPDTVMTRMTEVSRGESKQPQIAWQLDFRKPLVSQQAADQAYNTWMQRYAAGSPMAPNAGGQLPWSAVSPSGATAAVPTPAPAGGFSAPLPASVTSPT